MTEDCLRCTVYRFCCQALNPLASPLDIRWPYIVFALIPLPICWQGKKVFGETISEVKIRSCTSLLCFSVHCLSDGVRTTSSFTVIHVRVLEAALHSWPAMIHRHINNHFIWYLLHNLAALMTSGSNVVPTASDYPHTSRSVGRCSRCLNEDLRTWRHKTATRRPFVSVLMLTLGFLVSVPQETEEAWISKWRTWYGTWLILISGVKAETGPLRTQCP